MTKQEFIDLLISLEADKGIFQGRFYRPSKFINSSFNNDHWVYVRPAVDCMEPSIDLTVDGEVKYYNYESFINSENDSKIYTYEEFIKLYHLDK